MIYTANIIWVVLIIVNVKTVIKNTILLLLNKKMKEKLGSKLIEERNGFRLIYIASACIIIASVSGLGLGIREQNLSLILTMICVLIVAIDHTMMLTYKKCIYTNGICTNNEIILIGDILSTSIRIHDDRKEIDFTYNGELKLVNPNHLTFRTDDKDNEIIEIVITIYQPS